MIRVNNVPFDGMGIGDNLTDEYQVRVLKESVFKKLTTRMLAEVLTNAILNLNTTGGPPDEISVEKRSDPTAVLLGIQDPFKARAFKGFVLAGVETMAKLMQAEGYAGSESEMADLENIQYKEIESFMGMM